MIFKKLSALCLPILLSSPLLAAKISVLTTIPDLAWMAQEIGGDRVEAKALLRGTENPHFVDSSPSFVRLVAEAQVVCLVGLDLEVGYMPPVLAKSGNAKVQAGGPGYCEVGKAIQAKEKPTGPIDRSLGDVHPGGNPHYFLSPSKMSEGAKEIADVLSRVDPGSQAQYAQGLKNFRAKMESLSKEIFAKLEPLRAAQKQGPILIEYHREYLYFLEEYGIKSFGSIEDKPGVPPSAARLADIAKAAQAAGVKLALGADYNPIKTLQRFEEISRIPLVIVPTMIQSKGELSSYEALQRHIAESLLKALSASAKPKQ